MSDPQSEKPSSSAMASIIAALPSEVKGILSALLVFFAFMSLMFALTNMPAYFKNLASSSSAKEYCWELKETQSGLFKFNKCTGEATQLEAKTKAPSDSTNNKPPPVAQPGVPAELRQNAGEAR